MKKINIIVPTLLLFLSVIALPTFAKADTSLPLNTVVSGSITEQEPMDAYTVTVQEAGILSIDVSVYFSAAFLEIRNAKNERIGNFAGIFHGRPENATALNKKVNLEPGVYTIIVKDYNRTSYGNYDLQVSFTPANNTEIEPNQSIAEAMAIQVNDKKIRGFISANDTEDYYKIELVEQGRLFLEIDSQMMNGTVRIYDANGETVTWDSLGFYNGLPLLWKSHIDFDAGTYYISVTGNDTYQGIYEMLVSFAPANTDEVEPNNSIVTATPVQLNDLKTHKGFLSYTDTKDYYKIEMPYDGYLTVEFSSEFSAYHLIDEKDVPYDSYVSSGAVGIPETSTRKQQLKKGTYYVVPMKGAIWQGGIYTLKFSAEPESKEKHAFRDVTGRYTTAVNYLVDKDVTNGMTPFYFGVNEKIKRVDAAIWLAKMLELDTSNSASTPYLDVPKRAWGAVNALKQADIANGKSKTQFGANDTMTRGEMALMIQRAYQLSSDGVHLPFIDVSPRYEDAVKALLKHNITQGKSANQFGTNIAITRGEMAIFLHRADETK